MSDEAVHYTRPSIEGDWSGAFIYIPGGVTVDVTGALSNVHLYGAGGYTPPLLRRPRLKRFAPLAHRVQATQAFMEFLTL